MSEALEGIELVCLDIDGTLTEGVGGNAYPGAVEAIKEVASCLPIRFVTNATSRSHRALFGSLVEHDFPVEPEWLYTPSYTARKVLVDRGHTSGVLLGDEASREDFSWFEEKDHGTAVVLATEAHDRTIADLQPAFRSLLKGAAFYTLQRNRFFRKGDAFWTDLGPVASFLTYASESEAETLGKPSSLLFDAIADAAGVARERILMVGDDAEFDVSAVRKLGMEAVLVRTGKYREGDEKRHSPGPTVVLESVADLPSLIHSAS